MNCAEKYFETTIFFNLTQQIRVKQYFIILYNLLKVLPRIIVNFAETFLSWSRGHKTKQPTLFAVVCMPVAIETA